MATRTKLLLAIAGAIAVFALSVVFDPDHPVRRINAPPAPTAPPRVFFRTTPREACDGGDCDINP